MARVGSVVRDEKKREDIQLIGADLKLQNQAYAFDFASKDDAALTASDSLLITQSYADKHRLSLRSRVTLSFGMQKKRFKVRGILKDNLNFMAKTDMYAQKAAVQSLVGEKGKIYSVGISIKQLDQIDVVAAAVRRLLPKKLEVQTTYDLSQYENTIEMVDISFRLLAAIGILLAMFLCYSLYREMIYERMNQMGGLKCLGVSQRELDLMYLIEYLEFSVPSAGIGILLSKPLLQKLMMTMNGYSIAVSPASLMKGCLAVLLFLAVNPVLILWMLH
ncbi:MAG: ABC transporter permease, partial [Bulleidia sp.]